MDHYRKPSSSARMGVLISLVMCFMSLAVPARNVAAEVLVECDELIDLGSNWRNTSYGRDVDNTQCYQVPGSLILKEMTRRRAPLLIELLVSDGDFDVYMVRLPSGEVPNVRPADRINDEPVYAGMQPETFVINDIRDSKYVIAVTPSFEGERGSFRLRLKVTTPPRSSPPLPQPPQPQPPGSDVILLPTTTDGACSVNGAGLSNLCVEPYPATSGNTVFASWRIPNFSYGEFDRGDGRGFVGPILAEQRVEVTGMYALRVIRLRWVSRSGQQYIDSIAIPVQQPVQPPSPQLDTFPCSRAGIGSSNLCVQQPYPTRRGGTASVVWRITSFKYGEFDSGDGRGYVGPIAIEQRVDIPNIQAPRQIRLKWIDRDGREHVDVFVIQVVD